jgi:hypothetical protein
VSACSNVRDDDSSSSAPKPQTNQQALNSNSQSSSSQTFRHPFADATRQGKVVLHGVKNNKSGERYAVGVSKGTGPNGTSKKTSGVITLNREQLTKAERKARINSTRKQKRERIVKSAPTIGPDLRAWMNQAQPYDHHDVHIYVSEPKSYVSLNNKMEKAIARGEVQSDKDFKQKRKEFIAQKHTKVANRLNPVVNHLLNIGGKLLSRCQNTFCLGARLTSAEIQKLETFSTVARINKVQPTEDDAIRGTQVVKGTQIKQFLDAGYPATSLHNAGVMENNGFNKDHSGFLDYNGGPARIGEMYDCNGGACSSVTNFSNPDNHATAVAGLVLGDLTEDQDPLVSSPSNQVNTSGYAREANLFFWTFSTNNEWGKAMDHAIGYELRTVNMSLSATGDQKCLGKTSLSKTANDMYEAGFFVTKSASNDGHSSTSDCTVGEPGAAIGMFTVGAHTSDPSNEDEHEVRYGDIDPDSSRGGTSSSEGKNRTIIDVTAPGARELMFDTSGTYSYSGDATSFSTPTVSAAALDFMHFYESNYGTGNIHPGSVTANMLLMGDRQKEKGGKRTSGFSNLWGAGRLKMRMWDNSGMDAPWEWGSYSTCVDDSQTVYHQLDDSILSSDVDVFKAVTWWYDERHENGKSIDDIDLTLQEQKSSGWTSVAGSADSYDEKERVFYSDFSSGNSFRIAIDGSDVTSDKTSCGTNSMKVHYAFFYEDSERDDSNGPDCSEIDPESNICTHCPNASVCP